MALLAVVLAASAAGGLVALRTADALPEAEHEHLLSGLATGLGLASILALALAALHALRPLPLGVAGGLALAVGAASLWRAVRAVRLPRGAFSWALVAACGLVLLAEAPTWFAPPIGGDQTKYHLAYPRLYGLAGGLVATPWSFWGQQQWLQNFLFAIAYALRGEDLARLLNAITGVTAALGLATLARRHLGEGLGVLVGALFFTMPMTWSQMTRAGADMSVVLYAALAMSAWLDWVASERRGDLRRAAIFAGFAGASKVMGLLVPVLVGVGVLVVLARRRWSPGRTLAAAVSYGAIALTLLAPCYVRNAIDTGNPLHPFGNGAFHGRYWSPAAAAYLDTYYDQYRTREAGDRGGKPYVGLEVLRFPWDLTMHPESFENGKRQGQDVSPLPLAFAPAVLLLARTRWQALAIGALGVAYGAIIAGGAWAHPRYVLPGTALALTAAVAGARALVGERVLPWIVAFTVAGDLALTSRMLRPMWPDQVRVALGRMTPDAFLARYSDRYVFWREANRVIPPTGRVAVLEKIPHPYYIERPFVLLSYLEQGFVDFRAVTTPDAVLETLRALGVTHVAVEVKGLDAAADPFEQQVTSLWRASTTRLDPPVLTAGGYALYVAPAGAPRG
ncbi:MAG: glycosyltransferase family 39 protein [Candidatus Binatia bacterium]